MLIAPGTKPIFFTFTPKYRTSLQNREVKWNIEGLSEFTFTRTYARTKENGKLESWNDCVIRVIEGMFSILKTYAKINHIPWDEKRGQKLSQEAADRMFCFKWLPPGRGLWMMGTNFVWERGSGCLNNCYFISTEKLGESVEETLFPFRFLMDMSMLGGGVGFDTKGATNEHNLHIKGYSDETVTFVVEDTREGWIDAASLAIENGIYGGPRVELDTHLVRGPGALIKGFGGVSSGPAPLVMLVKGIVDILSSRAGQKLTSVTITDLMNLEGKCVVSGNVRRSSEIAFSEPDDSAFFEMKNWSKHPVEMDSAAPEELKEESLEDYQLYNANIWNASNGVKSSIIKKYENKNWAYKFGGWRQASNNSVFAKVGMNYSKYESSIKESGEPGFAWLELMQAYGRMKDPLNNKDHRVKGGNPCQPDFALLLTPEGIKKLKDIEVGSTVWSGKQWTKVIKKWKTGEKNVNIYHTTAGRFIGTDKHKVFQKGEKVEVKNVETIDICVGPIPTAIVINDQDVIDGLVIGDGTVHKASNDLVLLCLGKKDNDTLRKFKHKIGPYRPGIFETAYEVETTILASQLTLLPNRKIPARFIQATTNTICGFLKGLYSANGSVVDTRVQFKATSFNIISSVQAMLSSVGIRSYYTTNKSAKVKFSNGTYKCKKSYDLNISSKDVETFYNLIGFIQDYKMHKLRKVVDNYTSNGQYKTSFEVKKIESLGKMPVYDITVEAEEHSYWTEGLRVSNCLEQSLESGEGCNLVETFISHCDDYWDFQRTLKFAFLYAKTVTLMGTHIQRTNAIMIRNRRIGCSMSGITDAIVKFGRTAVMQEFCDKGYNYINGIDRKYSDWLGIPESVKKTSIKPSGTISLVAGVYGPGGHFAKIKTGFRLIRVPSNSPLVPLLLRSNYKVEPALTDPLKTMVVYFPLLPPEHIITEDQTTIWEKFKMAADLQYWWADNQVSCTVEFTKEEADRGEIARCLEAFDGQIKGISLLPAAEGIYQQMPFTRAEREEVIAYRDNLFPLDFSSLTQEGENSDALKFCDGDHCVV